MGLKKIESVDEPILSSFFPLKGFAISFPMSISGHSRIQSSALSDSDIAMSMSGTDTLETSMTRPIDSVRAESQRPIPTTKYVIKICLLSLFK